MFSYALLVLRDSAVQVLVGWLSGNGPAAIDSMSDEELTKEITEHFRDLIVDVDIPAPKQIIR